LAGLAILGIFVFAFWQTILAVTVSLAVIGGLGAFIWKIKKHGFCVKKELFIYKRKRALVDKEQKRIDNIKSKRNNLSRSDYQAARKHAEQLLQSAILKANEAAQNAIRQLDEQENHLNETRCELLKRASKINEKKLVNALSKIDSAINVCTRIKQRIAEDS